MSQESDVELRGHRFPWNASEEWWESAGCVKVRIFRVPDHDGIWVVGVPEMDIALVVVRETDEAARDASFDTAIKLIRAKYS